MSDVYSYEGKMVPVKLADGQTLEQWIQEELGTTKLKSYEDSWLEKLADDRYQEFHYDATSKVLYRVEKNAIDNEGFVYAQKQEDGSYWFVTSFYNGGTHLNEMLQDGIDEA